eukprot:TRINITY_DN67564_c11_g1_i1.p1 TRINITY_DN67564_c11_g1~~TRINITY_DN67564_c11_g1_i1.p1  ORF type:complete len:512 (+),score=82.97 TRINITY_DN67564_c11_g1_i1:103-1536(+)
MEEAEDFNMDDPEYLELQEKVTELRHKEAESDKKLGDKERTLQELDVQRKAVAEKAQEVEAAKVELEEHKKETEEKLAGAQADIQRQKWKEQNRRAIQEDHRPQILAKIQAAHDKMKADMLAELQELQEELAEKTAERDEQLASKISKERAGITVQREDNTGNFTVRNGPPRSHSATRGPTNLGQPTPRVTHVSLGNGLNPQTPRGNTMSSPSTNGELMAADLKSMVDKLPGQPKPGTPAYEWEGKAYQKLRVKCQELARYRTSLKEKEKEIEELRLTLTQQIKLRKQGKDEIQAALDAVSPSKQLRIDTHRSGSSSGSGTGRSYTSNTITSESPTITTGGGPSTSRSMASASSQPPPQTTQQQQQPQRQGRSFLRRSSPSRGDREERRGFFDLPARELSRGRSRSAANRSSSQPAPASQRSASNSSRRSNSSGRSFLRRSESARSNNTEVFDLNSPPGTPGSRKKKGIFGIFRRKK